MLVKDTKLFIRTLHVPLATLRYMSRHKSGKTAQYLSIKVRERKEKMTFFSKQIFYDHHHILLFFLFIIRPCGNPYTVNKQFYRIY